MVNVITLFTVLLLFKLSMITKTFDIAYYDDHDDDHSHESYYHGGHGRGYHPYSGGNYYRYYAGGYHPAAYRA